MGVILNELEINLNFLNQLEINLHLIQQQQQQKPSEIKMKLVKKVMHAIISNHMESRSIWVQSNRSAIH